MPQLLPLPFAIIYEDFLGDMLMRHAQVIATCPPAAMSPGGAIMPAFPVAALLKDVYLWGEYCFPYPSIEYF